MSVSDRKYDKNNDYNRVISFLRETYLTNNHYPCWLAQRFEDMEYRINVLHITRGQEPWHSLIHIWEDNDIIVGICNGESKGEAFMQIRNGYENMFPQMLDLAENNLSLNQNVESSALSVIIFDSQTYIAEELKSRGYLKETECCYVMEHDLNNVGKPVLPDGYQLVFGDEYQDKRAKANTLDWGFQPQDEGNLNTETLPSYFVREKAPMFDYRYEVLTKDSNDNLCSYAYFWVDKTTRCALVEPVSTRIAYRKIGLGKAMLVALLNRIKEDGILKCYVEPFGVGRKYFYTATGFTEYDRVFEWKKQ